MVVLKMMQRSRMGNASQSRAFPQSDGSRALGSHQFVDRIQQSLPEFPVMVPFRHTRILAIYLDDVKIVG
jgi:hypothetical protein